MKLISFLMRKLLLTLLFIYQWAISPLLPRSCRFYPSCSNYAIEACKNLPIMQAIRSILVRLFHCSPLSKKWPHGGIDMPPAPISKKKQD
ncbi:MAG: membrane protein insertion efficiency factor YidD [Chlamydia sp.]